MMTNHTQIISYPPYENSTVDEIPSWWLEYSLAQLADELDPTIYSIIEVEYNWRTVMNSHWDTIKK